MDCKKNVWLRQKNQNYKVYQSYSESRLGSNHPVPSNRDLCTGYDDTKRMPGTKSITVGQKEKLLNGWRYAFGITFMENKDCSGRPKIYEAAELEELLEEDSSQTQKELAPTLEVTQQAVSHRLKSLGIIHKQVAPVKNYLKALDCEVLPHPPYSPDIAPSDYHLFRSMAHALPEQRST
ncbi:Mariner Mos1 transposase [Eumeta japonica]|uniref:Mariner Mos1 transposase n=1 Tax=Eumeta variegata TaxID=151549 RepID=A0A4C1TI13_EUMVA|nr:Mariner Mos1 transposase [Eumeta japonica]